MAVVRIGVLWTGVRCGSKASRVTLRSWAVSWWFEISGGRVTMLLRQLPLHLRL